MYIQCYKLFDIKVKIRHRYNTFFDEYFLFLLSFFLFIVILFVWYEILLNISLVHTYSMFSCGSNHC